MNPERIERLALSITARSLERHMAKRRKLLKQLNDLDNIIRTERKLVRDLTSPITPDPTLTAESEHDRIIGEGARVAGCLCEKCIVQPPG